MKDSCEARQKPQNFKELIKSPVFRKSVLAIIFGGAAGFLYYYFAKDANGDPYMNTLGGSLLGFFFVNRPCSRCA